MHTKWQKMEERIADSKEEPGSEICINSLLVSERDLSLLASKLGREWRGFLRSELEIKQCEIEHVESECSLPVAEKIFRLLKLWRSKKKDGSTVQCLVSHLQHFEYTSDTWGFLTERNATAETKVVSEVPSTSTPDRLSPYDTAIALGVGTRELPRFCFVAEVIENVDVRGLEETMSVSKGTKIDIVDKMTASLFYLGRDKDGHLFHIPKEICTRIPINSPVLWENSWFHEGLCREHLNDSFKNTKVGTFVIRPASQKGNFAISVKAHANILNFIIECTLTGYKVSNDTFYSLTDLISSFSGEPIYSTHEGKVYLRRPLPKAELP